MFQAFQEFFTNLPANFEGWTDQLTLLKLFKLNQIHIISLKNWEMAILKISSVVFQKLYGLFAKWGESSWLKVTYAGSFSWLLTLINSSGSVE